MLSIVQVVPALSQAGAQITVLVWASVGSELSVEVVAVTTPVPSPTVKLAMYLDPPGTVVGMLVRVAPVIPAKLLVSLQATPTARRAGLVTLVSSVILDLTV